MHKMVVLQLNSQLQSPCTSSRTSVRVRPSQCVADTNRSIDTEAVFSHFAVVHSDRTRDSTETWEVPSEHQETFFHCEGDHALAQVAQTDGGVSLLAGIHKLSRHCPGQVALGGPARAVGLDQVLSFQFQPDCDSG